MTLLELRTLLRLDEGPGRVLVVEDAAGHYDVMLRWLEHERHTVTTLGEVHDLEEDVLTGETLYGEPASAELRTIDVAFLDFYFPREPWNGGRLARALIAANPQIRVFGMSSVASKNEEMVRQGALGGLLKRELGRLIATEG